MKIKDEIKKLRKEILEIYNKLGDKLDSVDKILKNIK